MDYDEMLKSELIDECQDRGLEDDGLKADLIARLKAYDESKKEAQKEEPKKKVERKVRTKVWNPQLFRYEFK